MAYLPPNTMELKQDRSFQGVRQAFKNGCWEHKIKKLNKKRGKKP